jgi:hypothetical protein
MTMPVILWVLLGLTGVVTVGAYLTNPFSRFSIVQRPFKVTMVEQSLEAINENHRIRVRQNALWRAFAYAVCAIHVISSRYLQSPAARSKTVDGIVSDIHRLRFNPRKLLVISGDQFSALYVRNLGVFYYPLLDRSIPSTTKDWHDRQIVYLQTVAYALGVFAQHPQLSTTIVPTSRYGATCINIYAYPSDTLYGILYALAVLSSKKSAHPYRYAPALHQLNSKPASALLLSEYRDSLMAHYQRYRGRVFDEDTLLIKKSIHMSGAKDITRRTSSFYDNVIFWKTTKLAMTLKLIDKDKDFLRRLKAQILRTFWLDDEGHFLEDLDPVSVQRRYYSSDWLIVLATGFLDPADPSERSYFARSVDHIQATGVDQPFGLRYHNDTRAHRQFLPVRLAVASYGGDAIWSFWGMEYIKVLLALHRETGEDRYLETADRQIGAYQEAMVRDGGFPEVYDGRGQLLQTPLYRSIRQTGWVIGFEQVLAIRAQHGSEDARRHAAQPTGSSVSAA